MKANWKVGDKVKVLREIDGHEFEIGSIVEVVGVRELVMAFQYLCTCGNVSWYLSEEEAELIEW